MFILPQLPFTISGLEPYIDSTTIEIHYGKHHATYLNNLNGLLPDKSDSDLISILSHLDKIDDSIRTKVRNNAGGVYNHNLYWQTMSPKPQDFPSGQLLEMINDDFVDFANFKTQFTQASIAHFGSGWMWLVLTSNRRLQIISTPNQNNPLMDNTGTPLLCIDLWEHAYYLKYQNRRAEYIENWWKLVNWMEVERNLLSLS